MSPPSPPPLDDDGGRKSPVPLVVQHLLLGLTDVELHVVAVAPCVEALSVL